jgi:hypothetical protein
MKKCPECKILKKNNEFYLDKTNKTNGLSSYCKDCKREKYKNYYKKRKEFAVIKSKENLFVKLWRLLPKITINIEKERG